MKMLRLAAVLALLLPATAEAAWKHVNLPIDVNLRAVAVVGPDRFQVSGSKGTHAVTVDGGRTWRQTAPLATEALDFPGSPQSTRRRPSS